MGADVESVLREAAALHLERAATYRDNHERLAKMLAALFPDGITLRIAEDYARFLLLALELVKLTRYAVQWEHGHNDSLHDAIVYLAMLAVRDGARADIVNRDPNG
jgi:hypothetical protein